MFYIYIYIQRSLNPLSETKLETGAFRQTLQSLEGKKLQLLSYRCPWGGSNQQFKLK